MRGVFVGIGIPEMIVVALVIGAIVVGARMWRGPAWVPPAAPRIETDDRLTRLEGRVGDLERKLDSIRQLLAPDAAAPGASPAACPLTEEGRAAVLDLIRQNRKIEAIKAYREKTGSGLKEAKDAVEAMERGGRA